jgi:hypothetical protein
MTENSKSCLYHQISFSRFLLGLSVFVILGTLIASIFALGFYNSMCICTINFLAYAWIAFAVTALLALVTLNLCIMANTKEDDSRRYVMINSLLWLQSLGFLLGLIFMVVFIARYTNVI